ncbi:hypothetical protein ACSSS7_007340 [Eimeria intestinalis]
MIKATESLLLPVSPTGGQKSTSILEAQETLSAFVRMGLGFWLRLRLLGDINHGGRLPVGAPWLSRGPPPRSPCGLDCLGPLKSCAAAAFLGSGVTEAQVPVHLLALQTELANLREWGHQVMDASGCRPELNSSSTSLELMHQPAMRRPLFAKPAKTEKMHAAEEQEVENVYQPEGLTAGGWSCVGLHRFFEGTGKPSEHVRMLELENRQLCKEKTKLEAQLRDALASKEAAEKEREAAAAREAALDSSLRTKEQALELDSASAAMEALQQRLEEANQTIDKTTQELMAAREHTQDLEAAL